MKTGARGRAAILAGDFNATPASPHYCAIERAGLCECHETAGRGRGATWPRTGLLRFAPGIRLDHVFASAPLDIEGAWVARDIGSDHRPVVARIRTHP